MTPLSPNKCLFSPANKYLLRSLQVIFVIDEENAQFNNSYLSHLDESVVLLVSSKLDIHVSQMSAREMLLGPS